MSYRGHSDTVWKLCVLESAKVVRPASELIPDGLTVAESVRDLYSVHLANKW